MLQTFWSLASKCLELLRVQNEMVGNMSDFN